MSLMRKLYDAVEGARPALGMHSFKSSHPDKPKLKSKNAVKEIKCVVVGDGGVGKTSMLLAYTTGTFLSEYTPTVFDTFAVTMNVNDQQCNVGLYDTAGQETYDNLRSLVYFDTDVFIVCFSVIRPESFENVRSRWIPELKLYRPKSHFVLVGTQIDLREEALFGSPSASSLNSLCKNPDNSLTSHNFLPTCITRRIGSKLASKVGADGYYECSALTQEGLANVFEKSIASLLKPKRHVILWRSIKSLTKKRPFAR